MTEHALSHQAVNRRDFLTTAGLALGSAAAAGLGTAIVANPPQASWLRPVAAGDPRIGQLKRMRSANVAERTFGPLDWAAVRETPLNPGARAGLNDERVYHVPIRARDASTLLVISAPSSFNRERGALDGAGSRNGDRSLFNDDVVVQLSRSGVPELRWWTVDGRALASRHATGERRLTAGPAAVRLARGLGHPPLALASGIAACGDAGDELRRGERWPLTLYRAGASGKRRIRRCGAPLGR